MASWLRPLWVSLIGLVLAFACSSDAPKARLSDGCAINSDCNSPLVCAFKACHNACTSTRDCPDSERCVASDRPFSVCQLPSERDCTYNSQCGAGEVCGIDGQCRDQCSTDRDCVEGQLCVTGTCADPADLTDGKLPVKTFSDGGLPVSGQPCRYTSECPTPQVCRSGLCIAECLTSVDCSTGQSCVNQVCTAGAAAASDAGTGTGTSGTACVYNSDCAAPFACKSGLCRYECISDVDCNAGDRCVNYSCRTPGTTVAGSDAGCIPSTCRDRSANCGVTDDGCGGVLACGSCATGEACGGGGIANVCGKGTCVAKSCSSQGKNCGTISDGCSLLVDCGACADPLTCGGAGQSDVCGCKPAKNPCSGKDCGSVLDSCGNVLSCGGCTAPETCGGGDANQCGCTKTTCVAAGAGCGFVPDGCGDLLDCGACTTGTCGAAGKANQCGSGACTASTCATLADDCGSVSDGCAGKLDCGTCKSPDVCGGAGKANVCGCPTTTCAAENKNCGSVPDGCGGALDCGTCTAPATCGGSGTANVCGCVPTTCDAQKKNCGVIGDGCGGLLVCGDCTSPEVCGGTGIPNVCAKAERPPSCQQGGQGASNTCGTSNDDCCASNTIPGGTFNRDGNPTFPATLSAYRLDRYPVTVGRFRAFVNAGKGTQTSPPADWSGGFPRVANSGWDPEWTQSLAKTTAELSAALRCESYPSWTADPTQADNNPLTCPNWYEAMAFCAWDNGWLPTDAQYNFAEEAGSEQRYFPWSSPPDSKTVDITYVVFQDLTGANGQWVPVGSKSPKGDGKWGQADLIGNVYEMTMDVFSSPYAQTTCSDCSYSASSTARAVRGGNLYNAGTTSASRQGIDQGARWDQLGFRCARLP
ncbi:MAG TPA: SUMF1/EgtB/PvdO family nonheme iron enzyme [Polyangiaceae bacterium]|jgi:formylglycine-generating enzyme required for sulfatase activity|nr:SUMF1/EgtB/PvdO family nonheme iron enzyme [Polyangiaceae bacterium]